MLCNDLEMPYPLPHSVPANLLFRYYILFSASSALLPLLSILSFTCPRVKCENSQRASAFRPFIPERQLTDPDRRVASLSSFLKCATGAELVYSFSNLFTNFNYSTDPLNPPYHDVDFLKALGNYGISSARAKLV